MFNIFNNNSTHKNVKKDKGLKEFEELASQHQPQIDIKGLWKLNSTELEEIIKQQQNYFLSLKKGYKSQVEEFEPLLLKVDLLQNERVKLLDEIQEYKVKYEELMKTFQLECGKQRTEQREYKQESQVQLKESLNQVIQDLLHEFLEAQQEDHDSAYNQLMTQIDQTIELFVENLPPPSVRGQGPQLSFGDIDENKRLKQQAEKLSLELQKMQNENEDLSTALSIEKQHKDKIAQQRQQFQNDIQTLSEQFAKEKEKTTFFEKKSQEYYQKAQDMQIQIMKYSSQAGEEKEEIKNQLLDGIKTLQNELQQIEKEKQQLQARNGELLQQISEMEKFNQSEQENMFLKWKDFENKLVQERIKLDQKTKECTRFEKDYTQIKQEVAQVAEQNNQYFHRLELYKEKRKSEKKVLDDQKEKIKHLRQEMLILEERSNGQIRELQQKIDELEQKLKSTQAEEKQQQYLVQREMHISKLEADLQELTQRYNELKTSHAELKVQLSKMNEEQSKNFNTMKQLQEKREFAISEIKRLTSLNETLKQQISESKKPYNSMALPPTNNFEPDNNSSYVSSKSNQMEIHTPAGGQTPLSDNRGGILRAGINFLTRRGNTNSSQTQIKSPQQMDKKEAERILMMQAEDLRSNLEQLYKQYLRTLLLQDDSKNSKDELMKIERKINECVKKTQDLFDNIEDYTQL